MDWKDTIHEEIAKGGTESPCPFCKLPRCRRSDYIRCARCGTQWLQGEDLTKDPRIERRKKMLAELASLATTKTKKDGEGSRTNER